MATTALVSTPPATAQKANLALSHLSLVPPQKEMETSEKQTQQPYLRKGETEE